MEWCAWSTQSAQGLRGNYWPSSLTLVLIWAETVKDLWYRYISTWFSPFFGKFYQDHDYNFRSIVLKLKMDVQLINISVSDFDFDFDFECQMRCRLNLALSSSLCVFISWKVSTHSVLWLMLRCWFVIRWVEKYIKFKKYNVWNT